MTDLSATIAPKSDQLNSDDLIAGPMTIRLTKVAANPSAQDQPISIFFDGDNGKPYKPCKSMRRVLVSVWGRDGAQYAGRAMTLYREPSVTWGGIAVGGIRISHMNCITEPVTLALTAAKSSRKPYTVQPLLGYGDPVADEKLCRDAAAKSMDALQSVWTSLGGPRQKAIAHLLPGFKKLATTQSPDAADPALAAQGDARPEEVAAAAALSSSGNVDDRTPRQLAVDVGHQHAKEGRSVRAMPAEYRSSDELREAYENGFASYQGEQS